MKKIVMIWLFMGAVLFTGCASNGMAINTVDGNKVDRYFHQGVITQQRKVVIDDRMLATLSGVGVGAVAGVATGRDAKGAAIGAVIGGLAGAFIGKEVVAYETTILSDKNEYQGFLKQKLTEGSTVEFTVVDGKLKNVELISSAPASKFEIIN